MNADFRDDYDPPEREYVDAAEVLPVDEYDEYMRAGGSRWRVNS